MINPQNVLPEDMIGKKVVLKNGRFQGREGILNRYYPNTDECWVWLNEQYKTQKGRKTNWHKCKAAQLRLHVVEDTKVKQLSLFD